MHKALMVYVRVLKFDKNKLYKNKNVLHCAGAIFLDFVNFQTISDDMESICCLGTLTFFLVNLLMTAHARYINNKLRI